MFKFLFFYEDAFSKYAWTDEWKVEIKATVAPI